MSKVLLKEGINIEYNTFYVSKTLHTNIIITSIDGYSFYDTSEESKVYHKWLKCPMEDFNVLYNRYNAIKDDEIIKIQSPEEPLPEPSE